MKFNYEQICFDLLVGLKDRPKEIILRRYALKSSRVADRKTLQSIGNSLGITRERVRQIEGEAFLVMRKNLKQYPEVIDYFKKVIKQTGNVRREELLLEELAPAKFHNHVYLLLCLAKDFVRIQANERFYALWTTDREVGKTAHKAIDSFYEKLKKNKKLLVVKEKPLIFYLEISKKIVTNKEGLYGLRFWPEINPKRIKDKAYFALKEQQQPLHFAKLASLISPVVLSQTVHNELIRDKRFVLVGKGIYALKEWGYEAGVVRDVIIRIIKNAGKPLSRQEVLNKTLAQRVVKENTVLLNLSNKKYFLRDADGFYSTREA